MSHYRLALYLTSAVALLEALLVASISSFDVALARSASVRPFVAVVIVFGLWVQSKIARYLGVAWYVLMIVSVVWALPSARVWSVTLALFLVVSLLQLAGAGILLLSKEFAREFAEQREKQPFYKKQLAVCGAIAVIAVIVVMFAIDYADFSRP